MQNRPLSSLILLLAGTITPHWCYLIVLIYLNITHKRFYEAIIISGILDGTYIIFNDLLPTNLPLLTTLSVIIYLIRNQSLIHLNYEKKT